MRSVTLKAASALMMLSLAFPVLAEEAETDDTTTEATTTSEVQTSQSEIRDIIRARNEMLKKQSMRLRTKSENKSDDDSDHASEGRARMRQSAVTPPSSRESERKGTNVMGDCGAAAVATREASLGAAFSTFASSMSTAYSTRAAALADAWKASNKDQVKAAWMAFKEARKAAAQTFRTAVEAAWKTFRSSISSCKGATASTSVLSVEPVGVDNSTAPTE